MVKTRKIKWSWHVACIGKRKGAYRFLVGKPKRKSPLLRRKFRLENNIKTELQEVEWCSGLD
jgi:hypothetical protein